MPLEPVHRVSRCPCNTEPDRLGASTIRPTADRPEVFISLSAGSIRGEVLRPVQPVPHTEAVPDLNAPTQEHPDEGGSLDPVVTTAAVCSAVAVVAGVTSDATSGVPHVIFGVLMVVTGLYALYTIGVLVIWFGLNRMINNIVQPKRTSRTVVDRFPWFVWVGVPLLIGAWALSAWLSGYDNAEWLWSGTSVVAASVVVLAVYFRRRTGSHR
jgi:hypothetical protein